MNSLNVIVCAFAIALSAVGLAGCTGAKVDAWDDYDSVTRSVLNEDVQAFVLDPAKAYSDNERLIASARLSARDALVRVYLIRRALDWSTVDCYRASFYRQAGDLYLRCNIRDAKANAYAAYFLAGVFGDSSAEKNLHNLYGDISKCEAFAATSYVAMYLIDSEASRIAHSGPQNRVRITGPVSKSGSDNGEMKP